MGRKAKRLPFERANPLHHISHNLLSFPITLWESISASSSHAAPLFSISAPLVLTSPVSYCCLAAFNPTHHPAVPCKLFVHASSLRNLGKRANPDSNEKRRKTQIRQEIVAFFWESTVSLQAPLECLCLEDTSKGASRACDVSRSGKHFFSSYLAESW